MLSLYFLSLKEKSSIRNHILTLRTQCVNYIYNVSIRLQYAMKKPILFSFFSGSGFLDLGFEHSGFNVGFVNEFHEAFLNAYKHSRIKMKIKEPYYGYHNGDIRDLISGYGCIELLHKVNEAKGESLVGFIGGPPCPDFSVGGKNKGEYGENGILTKCYIDAILTHHPDFFIFENVKGLWNTKKHRAFYNRMKDALSERYDLTDRLTNSIEYGSPQDRDRIFLFGINKKLSANIAEFPWQKFIKFDRDIALNKEIWPNQTGDDANFKLVHEWQRELTISHWFKINDTENHPNAKKHFTPRKGLTKFMTIREGDVSRKSYKRLHRNRFSPTAAYGNNEVHIHPYLPRRLSAAEAMALQSLPKEFELPDDMTLTDMFKTIGNGVPYLAAKGLADTVFDFLKNQNII